MTLVCSRRGRFSNVGGPDPRGCVCVCVYGPHIHMCIYVVVVRMISPQPQNDTQWCVNSHGTWSGACGGTYRVFVGVSSSSAVMWYKAPNRCALYHRTTKELHTNVPNSFETRTAAANPKNASIYLYSETTRGTCFFQLLSVSAEKKPRWWSVVVAIPEPWREPPKKAHGDNENMIPNREREGTGCPTGTSVRYYVSLVSLMAWRSHVLNSKIFENKYENQRNMTAASYEFFNRHILQTFFYKPLETNRVFGWVSSSSAVMWYKAPNRCALYHRTTKELDTNVRNSYETRTAATNPKNASTGLYNETKRDTFLPTVGVSAEKKPRWWSVVVAILEPWSEPPKQAHGDNKNMISYREREGTGCPTGTSVRYYVSLVSLMACRSHVLMKP